jgi:hypothetical protein
VPGGVLCQREPVRDDPLDGSEPVQPEVRHHLQRKSGRRTADQAHLIQAQVSWGQIQGDQEPILRLLILQLQRQRCIRLGRAFFKVEENNSVFETHWATHGVVNFYNAGWS